MEVADLALAGTYATYLPLLYSTHPLMPAKSFKKKCTCWRSVCEYIYVGCCVSSKISSNLKQNVTFFNNFQNTLK